FRSYLCGRIATEWLIEMKKSTKFIHDFIFYAVAGIYVFVLIAALFLKATSLKSVNLIPFQFVADYFIEGQPLALSNVVGNVALFIPMGIYLTVLNVKQPRMMNLLWIVLFSTLVEVSQYILSVGVTDIDDLLLNSIGGFLGICCGWGLQKLFRERTRYAVEVLSLVAGCAFLTLYFCLYFGVFGFRILII
ncbi:MAG: VanZ family protein, partial [Eubacteriales bacterium]|nr:VanZ family protein [Eubacteriales bacterium]